MFVRRRSTFTVEQTTSSRHDPDKSFSFDQKDLRIRNTTTPGRPNKSRGASSGIGSYSKVPDLHMIPYHELSGYLHDSQAAKYHATQKHAPKIMRD
ncbi:hypothetical protein M7I_4532 [Glarea lozoyensis 74030]|uniref:Uncharacterized protein n=1 Tax=Glarea lozoyensis (strain ATCC 74030 / MF5533) TaxID=1104152 RepID=H0EPF5_GLAL7|nr:hypothetical protein M7I_4532 [Glarea lozoyensis 74030]